MRHISIKDSWEELIEELKQQWDNHPEKEIVEYTIRIKLHEGLIEQYKNIDHPNVCSVFAVEKYDDSILVVSDYIEGETLQSIILKNEFPKEKLLPFLNQISSGLEAIYDHDLVHGNLKPSNIIVTDDLKPILTDAGLSPFENFQKTPDFVVPYEAYHYLSPEQVQNQPPTEKSDYFS